MRCASVNSRTSRGSESIRERSSKRRASTADCRRLQFGFKKLRVYLKQSLSINLLPYRLITGLHLHAISPNRRNIGSDKRTRARTGPVMFDDNASNPTNRHEELQARTGKNCGRLWKNEPHFSRIADPNRHRDATGARLLKIRRRSTKVGLATHC